MNFTVRQNEVTTLKQYYVNVKNSKDLKKMEKNIRALRKPRIWFLIKRQFGTCALNSRLMGLRSILGSEIS